MKYCQLTLLLSDWSIHSETIRARGKWSIHSDMLRHCDNWSIHIDMLCDHDNWSVHSDMLRNCGKWSILSDALPDRDQWSIHSDMLRDSDNKLFLLFLRSLLTTINYEHSRTHVRPWAKASHCMKARTVVPHFEHIMDNGAVLWHVQCSSARR